MAPWSLLEDILRPDDDRWSTNVDMLADALRNSRAIFPEPPIAGSETIVPITSPVELGSEGRAMHHCVGSSESYASPLVPARLFGTRKTATYTKYFLRAQRGRAVLAQPTLLRGTRRGSPDVRQRRAVGP